LLSTWAQGQYDHHATSKQGQRECEVDGTELRSVFKPHWDTALISTATHVVGGTKHECLLLGFSGSKFLLWYFESGSTAWVSKEKDGVENLRTQNLYGIKPRKPQSWSKLVRKLGRDMLKAHEKKQRAERMAKALIATTKRKRRPASEDNRDIKRRRALVPESDDRKELGMLFDRLVARFPPSTVHRDSTVFQRFLRDFGLAQSRTWKDGWKKLVPTGPGEPFRGSKVQCDRLRAYMGTCLRKYPGTENAPYLT
jgi:hypothetical protein